MHNVSNDVLSQLALVCICPYLLCFMFVYMESETFLVQQWF